MNDTHHKENKVKIYFVLVRPKFAENIGFVARVIKNFGFNDLILIAPRCDISCAYKTAVHAKDVIKNAHVYSNLTEFLESENINYIIGTTAIITLRSVKNPKRCAITSDMLRNYALPSGKIAVLFGSEDYGLSTDELSLCDLTVTIPTSKEYPVMNISHAVAIIAYELALNLKTYRQLPYRPASLKEKMILVEIAGKLVREAYRLSRLPNGKIQILEEIFKHVLLRAFISGRECHSLIGLFKRIHEIIRKNQGD